MASIDHVRIPPHLRLKATNFDAGEICEKNIFNSDFILTASRAAILRNILDGFALRDSYFLFRDSVCYGSAVNYAVAAAQTICRIASPAFLRGRTFPVPKLIEFEAVATSMDVSTPTYSTNEVRDIVTQWLSEVSTQAGERDQSFLELVRWATNKNDENFRARLKLLTDTLFSSAYALAPQIAANTDVSTFDDVEAFIIFVGYPATGHSLIGSVLDAHPDMAIAHELHVTDWINAGTSRHELFSMLLRNSHCYARIERYWNEHSYAVPGQWQGRNRKLRIIGDKKGAPTTLACIKDPQLLRKLADLVDVPLKIIHAIRNPYDEIASRLRRYRLSDGGFNDPKEISKAIEWTAKLYAFNESFLAEADEYSSVYHLTHEELTENPSHSINRIIDFLGLEAEERYLSSCAGIVNTSPDPARFKLEWSAAQIDRVAEIIDGLSLFRDYRYSS